jgi:hypothetical protein
MYRTPALTYPRVAAPGRAVRDVRTGRCIPQQMSIEQYFTALGVVELFDPNDPGCILPMQYASTNALGFIGFQLGEQALIATGYYRARVVRRRGRWGFPRSCSSHYVGDVPDTAWRNGRREFLYSESILATDVNRWEGVFTGKHGIHTLDDLKQPELQDHVMRDVLAHNDACMRALFAERRFDIAASPYTWPALLAAAHLRGPRATVDYVTRGIVSADEFGTPITDYLTRFARPV